MTLPARTYWCVFTLVASVLIPSFAHSADNSTTPPNYNDHIKPILRQHCLKCHGNDKQEAGINLQLYPAVLRGGSAGQIVVAGRASKSRLYQAITNADDNARMPPNSPPLPAAKIAAIRQWIDAGLLESTGSSSLIKSRDWTFRPADKGTKPAGPPAMPVNLPAIKTPPVKHRLPVLSMDTSPWAPLLAVSAQDHVRLIHTETEQELGRLAFPEGVPQVIRFSRDGAILMAAGGRPVELGRVVLFDVRSGKRLAEIGDELDAVLAADLSPDQRLVALGGSARVAKVFSTTDGQQRYIIKKHTDWITAVGFSPDGSKLATADRSGGIHLWDAKSGGILLNLAEHKSAVTSLAWRSDGKVLVSAGDDGRIIWWDVTDGFPAISKANAHPPERPAGAYGRIPNGVLASRFDSRGRVISAGRDRTVRLWDPSGNPQQRFAIDSAIPTSVSIANSGKTAISGDSQGNVRFWNLE